MSEANKVETIKAVFAHDEVQKRFYDILGKKAPGFILSVINTVTNDINLAKADRNSILFAAATAAILDLPINPNLGFAYIVAYFDKHSQSYKAQFQMGYKGFIQLAQRSSQFETISAAPIYEGQLIEENPLTGYIFDFKKKQSDKVIGYAGYFKLTAGFEKTLYMTAEELQNHGVKYSQSFKKGYGLWKDNFDAMAIKTVLKLLLSKYAPLSTEMQKAVMTDQAIVNDWDGNSLSHTDNTPATAEDVSNEKERKRIEAWIQDSKTIEELQECGEYIETLEEGHELKALYLSRKLEIEKATKTKMQELPTA